MLDGEDLYPIDHSKIIDGFGDLTAARVYVPLDTFCGICDAPFTLQPRFQKYILEVRRVPVKMLQRGAVYCVACRQRRSRINWLRQHERWRGVQDGAAELKRLRDEEWSLRACSLERYENARWPYPPAT